jgi:hypothetical protein
MSDVDRLFELLKIGDFEYIPELITEFRRTSNFDIIDKGSKILIDSQQDKLYIAFISKILKNTYIEIPITLDHMKSTAKLISWDVSWLYDKLKHGYKAAFEFYCILHTKNPNPCPENILIKVAEVQYSTNSISTIYLRHYLKYMVHYLTNRDYRPVVQGLWNSCHLI